MGDKIKTFLLISLVGISLLFTKKLWMELPNDVFDVFGKKGENHSKSYLLSDMIMPNKYLLNFSEKNHTLFYEDSKYRLWMGSRDILSGVFKSKEIITKEIGHDEFSKYDRKRSISFYFPSSINTYILARSLDVKEPNNITELMLNIDNIYISLEKGDVFLVLSNGERHMAIYDESIDVDQLSKKILVIEEGRDYNYYHSLRDFYKIDNDIYVSSNEIKNLLPIVYVENEIRNLNEEEKEKLAEKFLEVGIDYIGEIVEANGSNMYRYNQSVLKLNINGTLEYINPLEHPIKKNNLYQSLITAADFISKNAGIQRGMYLAKVEEIKVDDSIGYSLIFRYRVRGIPIILGNEMVDFIQMEVFNEHVRYYKHYIRKEMGNAVDKVINNPVNNISSGERMLSSFDIIDINMDFIIEKYLEDNSIALEYKEELRIEEVLSSSFVQDITLSYFDPCLKDVEDELIGVWVVRTNSGMYAFDVYNGSLVYEK